jgi:hypothetical protein
MDRLGLARRQVNNGASNLNGGGEGACDGGNRVATLAIIRVAPARNDSIVAGHADAEIGDVICVCLVAGYGDRPSKTGGP